MMSARRGRLLDGGAADESLNDGVLKMVQAISEAWAGQRAPQVRMLPDVLPVSQLPTPAETGTVDELRVGNIVARDLKVVSAPGLDLDVIGMNFLSELESWRVEGRTLILVPHHPQQS